MSLIGHKWVLYVLPCPGVMSLECEVTLMIILCQIDVDMVFIAVRGMQALVHVVAGLAGVSAGGHHSC